MRKKFCAQPMEATAQAYPVLPRSEVLQKDKWNVEDLYKNFLEWQKDFEKWGVEGNIYWKEYESFKGILNHSPLEVKKCLDKYFEISRSLSKLYTYAHLRHDEDVAEEVAKVAHERALSAYYSFKEKSSWFEPELLSQPESYLIQCLKDDSLKDYRVFLEAIIRMKPHILSGEQEALVSLTSKALDGPGKIFTSFLNADARFPKIQDSSGKSLDLTLGSYLSYLQSSDRVLRKNAFEALHKVFLEHENSVCEMLSAHVQTHIFEARSRKYENCLEAALFPHQIDTSVYRNLIKAVKAKLPVMHSYMKLRKKLLKVDELHCYDLYVPLIPSDNITMSYEDAEKEVIEAAGFLGKEYQSDLKKGLLQDRWVDRYENLRKRTGAYSSGCYDSMPYILMNYHGTLRDVMTLCHESGHSMQSLLSNRAQPYQYAGYPIFVAEVASTFFEEVLIKNLIRKSTSVQNKAYLINQKIDDIRATLFRQTLFAEFELLIHELSEKGIPLTPDLLKSEYAKLYIEYYGDALTIDEAIKIEWARIPHFYSNFYVYQYATGISAALSLVSHIEREGEKAKKAYLTFLSSGSSKFPLELLQIAGVDMTKPDAINDAINYFATLVQELEKLLP